MPALTKSRSKASKAYVPDDSTLSRATQKQRMVDVPIVQKEAKTRKKIVHRLYPLDIDDFVLSEDNENRDTPMISYEVHHSNVFKNVTLRWGQIKDHELLGPIAKIAEEMHNESAGTKVPSAVKIFCMLLITEEKKFINWFIRKKHKKDGPLLGGLSGKVRKGGFSGDFVDKVLHGVDCDKGVPNDVLNRSIAKARDWIREKQAIGREQLIELSSTPYPDPSEQSTSYDGDDDGDTDDGDGDDHDAKIEQLTSQIAMLRAQTNKK